MPQSCPRFDATVTGQNQETGHGEKIKFKKKYCWEQKNQAFPSSPSEHPEKEGKARDAQANCGLEILSSEKGITEKRKERKER